MARHQGPVLVDTNVIIESHRVNSWRALAGGYRVQTVDVRNVVQKPGRPSYFGAAYRFQRRGSACRGIRQVH